MIDCENEVYTRIARVLRDKFPGINVASEFVLTPATFPHVSIVQSDNIPLPGTMDTGDKENFVSVRFEINIYSNKTEGKKTECKKIAKAIDDTLYSMNFTRTAMTPVPNMEQATIYRLVVRYKVATDGKHFYRR